MLFLSGAADVFDFLRQTGDAGSAYCYKIMNIFSHIKPYAGVAVLASLSAAGCGGGSGAAASPPPASSSSSSASSSSSVSSTSSSAPASMSLSGHIESGAQPVSGAKVTVFAAGSQGYGSGDSALGTASSDGSGSWNAGFTCPSGDAQIYVVAQGGNAGQGDNSALALSAALGACSSLPAAVTLNEVTTVASVYALNAFLDTTGTHLGSSASNAAGLANASGMIAHLADLGSGQAATTLAGKAAGSTPTAAVNTLADILAACDSSGAPTAAPCTALMAAAPGAGGKAPATSLQALLNIARNPGAQVAALYALVSTTAPFQPVLTSAPSDWLLPVQFTGGGLYSPEAVAIDAAGDAWVANYGSAVSEFSPLGVALSGATGFTGGGLEESFSLAIDGSQHVWVTNEESASSVNSALGSITELGPDGSILSGASGYTSDIVFPQALAIDSAGNVWVAEFGDGAHDSSLVELSPSGTELSPSGGFIGGGLGFPVAVAIDASDDLWTADQGQSNVARFSGQGQPLSPSAGYLDNGGALFPSPGGVCLGTEGTVWVTLSDADSVVELQGSAAASPGAPLSPTGGFTGGGLTHPATCATDGAGNVWIVNYHGASVTELQGAGSQSPGAPLSGDQGFASGQVASPTGIAIDASGNVWVASSNLAVNSLTVLIGAAAPVRTPLQGLPVTP